MSKRQKKKKKRAIDPLLGLTITESGSPAMFETLYDLLDQTMWHDPTWGRIDRDVQEYVNRMEPESIGQRVAIENTLQNKRNREQGRPLV